VQPLVSLQACLLVTNNKHLVDQANDSYRAPCLSPALPLGSDVSWPNSKGSVKLPTNKWPIQLPSTEPILVTSPGTPVSVRQVALLPSMPVTKYSHTCARIKSAVAAFLAGTVGGGNAFIRPSSRCGCRGCLEWREQTDE
jgi:hypothetical protein